MSQSQSQSQSQKKKAGSGTHQDFMEAFWICLLHLMKVRKGHAGVDKGILKFVEAYFEDLSASENDSIRALSVPLMDFLLTQLKKGLNSKSSVVRFRVCQLLSILLNHMEEIDDNLHEEIRAGLINRMRDKDASVRSHAALALSRFQGPPEEMDEEILSILLDLMDGDPSADVRKSLLWNIDIEQFSLQPLLVRCRDCDPSVRRMVYQKFAVSIPDCSVIPVQARDALLAMGLRDRDPTVVRKCVNMLTTWYKNSQCGFIEFLQKLGVVFTASAELAVEALVKNSVVVEESVTGAFQNISSESSLIARIYCKHLYSLKMEEKLQNLLPSLTDHAQWILSYLEKMSALSSSSSPSSNMELLQLEFILRQLLLLTEVQDYSDEIGRRRMLEVLKTVIVNEDLAPENLPAVAKGLYLASSATECCGIIAEIVCEIEEMAANQTCEGAVDLKDLALLQSLEVIKSFFEILDKPYKRDASFECLLHRFVLPGVRSANATIRSTGLNCLSLACCLDKVLASENQSLFLHLIQNKDKNLQKLTLKTIFDLVMLYGTGVFDEEAISYVIKYGLGSNEADVLVLIVEGACKLIMTKMISDPEILEALAILYFHPSTQQHQRLRQCLSFFFPMYLLSSFDNQRTFGKVMTPILASLIAAYSGIDSESGLNINLIAGQLLEWTDWRRIESFRVEDCDLMKKPTTADKQLHADMALEFIERLVSDSALQKDGAKVIGLFILDKDCEKKLLQKLQSLCEDLRVEVITDAAAVKNLKKFTDKIDVILNEHLSDNE